jgi:ABC-2 type transport system ATP-binding protein
MQEVEALCDRVLIVKGGRLVVDAALADLRQARELELITNLDTSAVRAALASTSHKTLRPLANTDGAWRTYRIELDCDKHLHDVAASIAASIIAAAGHVAALQPVVRNLETLFRDVSEATEDKRHAA